MAETLSVAKNQILALKANQAESPDQPGNATELSAGNISETVINIEVTNSAVQPLQLLHALATMRNSTSAQADQKFSAVLFGISECLKGTKKHDRAKQDLTNVISAVSHIDHEITTYTRDCFHLGKYKQSAKQPCPILIKLTRAIARCYQSII